MPGYKYPPSVGPGFCWEIWFGGVELGIWRGKRAERGFWVGFVVEK